LGFEDINDLDPTQTLPITAEDLREGSDPIVLKFVKFQRVIRASRLSLKKTKKEKFQHWALFKLKGRNVATMNNQYERVQKEPL
jgi:hypothetical protein